MAYTKYMVAHFGKSRTGLATVGYTLTGGSRITAGVAEEAAGSGIYGATVTFADAFAGSIVWDTGEGADTLFAVEEENPLDVTDVLGSVLGDVLGSVGSIATGGLTTASFAAGAIDATAFAQGAADKVWATASRSLTDEVGFKLAADGLDAVVVETGINARQAIALIMDAAPAGILTGAGTTTITVKDPSGVNDRIIAVVSPEGNRSATTLTPPA